MNTCMHCIWWGRKGEDEGIPQIPSEHMDHKVCGHPKVGGGSYNDDARNSFDSLNAYTQIGTGPDFGCIHYEQKAL